LALGFEGGLAAMADWAHTRFGGGADAASFSAGLISASILFCVGPLTVLGCVQDGIEGNIELLGLKSTMDGIASIFLAATFGVGVLFSAAVVLLFQGGLTLAARPLSPIAKRPELLAALSASGGTMMMAIGLGLLGIVTLPVVDYLPALALAPGLEALAVKYFKRREAVPW
jgi:uncharacterized membrane protein YqgA involved in biofilm formation